MPIGTWGERGVEVFREVLTTRIPFNRMLQMQVIELREGFARLAVPFREELIGDPWRRAIHGGVIGALIDACGGAAVFTMIDPPERVSTIDLRVDYLRPGAPEALVCESTVVRMGNRVASVDMRVFQQHHGEHVVASGKGVYDVRRAKKDPSTDAPRTW